MFQKHTWWLCLKYKNVLRYDLWVGGGGGGAISPKGARRGGGRDSKGFGPGEGEITRDLAREVKLRGGEILGTPELARQTM